MFSKNGNPDIVRNRGVNHDNEYDCEQGVNDTLKQGFFSLILENNNKYNQIFKTMKDIKVFTKRK